MYTGLRTFALLLVFFVVYWGSAFVFGNTATPKYAYFNYLADAFLHGRLHLLDQPATEDLIFYQGNWYMPFPPLPAFLLVPWVWAFGLMSVQTVLFAAIIGAVNGALIHLLLTGLSQRGWSNLSMSDNLWLTLLFELGSIHWYLSTTGAVWFIAQICTVTFVALSVWLAVANGSPWLTGLALGLAMLARPHVVLTWPLLLGIAAMHLVKPAPSHPIQPSDWRSRLGMIEWTRLLKWAISSAVPVTLAAAALLLYNNARFGNPLDFGYEMANVDPALAENLRLYGQFHLHYFPKNVWAMLLTGPLWDAERNFWVPNPEGMSLLLTTPALVYLLWVRRLSPLALGAWVALGLLLIPLLFYYNTGWIQFGYRFSLDFMVPVIVLLALAAEQRITLAMRALILAGILVNAYGVFWWQSIRLFA